MKKHFVLCAFTIFIAAFVLTGCSSKKDKNTTVTIDENTVVDVDD